MDAPPQRRYRRPGGQEVTMWIQLLPEATWLHAKLRHGHTWPGSPHARPPLYASPLYPPVRAFLCPRSQAPSCGGPGPEGVAPAGGVLWERKTSMQTKDGQTPARQPGARGPPPARPGPHLQGERHREPSPGSRAVRLRELTRPAQAQRAPRRACPCPGSGSLTRRASPQHAKDVGRGCSPNSRTPAGAMQDTLGRREP